MYNTVYYGITYTYYTRRSVRVLLESVLRVQSTRHVRTVVVRQTAAQVRGVRLHSEPGTTQQRRQPNHLRHLQYRHFTQHTVHDIIQ